jgi:hypothetical protein
MHKIIEIALGVALGLTLFLVVLWLLGTCVYICCGNTKKIATIKKLKNFDGIAINENEEKSENQKMLDHYETLNQK